MPVSFNPFAAAFAATASSVEVDSSVVDASGAKLVDLTEFFANDGMDLCALKA